MIWKVSRYYQISDISKDKTFRSSVFCPRFLRQDMRQNLTVLRRTSNGIYKGFKFYQLRGKRLFNANRSRPLLLSKATSLVCLGPKVQYIKFN